MGVEDFWWTQRQRLSYFDKGFRLVGDANPGAEAPAALPPEELIIGGKRSLSKSAALASSKVLMARISY